MINTGYTHCDPDYLQFTCDSLFTSIRRKEEGGRGERRIIGDVRVFSGKGRGSIRFEAREKKKIEKKIGGEGEGD